MTSDQQAKNPDFNLTLYLSMLVIFFEDTLIAVVDWLAIKCPLLRGSIMAIKTPLTVVQLYSCLFKF